MNIPLVVDIAIGLIFIYLTFSLLTSEIQELITTLLQWRAVHLKESIEGLLAGNNETPELKQARILANKLYGNPVINTLNQEAKGFGASLPRRLNQTIGKFFRDIFKRENVFGNKNSGPSYIGAESFATSLLETLGIPSVIQKFTLLRMQDFNYRLIAQVEGVLQSAAIPGISEDTLGLELRSKEDESNIQNYLNKNSTINDKNQVFLLLKPFYNLKNKLSETVKAYQNGSFDLEKSVDRWEEVFGQYIEALDECLQEFNPPQTELLTNLKAIQNDTFGKPKTDNLEETNNWSSEKALLLRSLQPNLAEAVEIVKGFWQIKSCWSVYKEVRKGAALDAISKLSATINNQPNLPDTIRQNFLKTLENITASNIDYGYERIKEIINKYPKLKPSIKQSLLADFNAIIENTYKEIRELIESQQEPDLPESIKNTLLQILENEQRTSNVSNLSYEFEKIRRTEVVKLQKTTLNQDDKTDTTVVASTDIINKLDDIINTSSEIISNSYEEIKSKINNEDRLPTSTKQSLLNLLDAITSTSLDFEYETLRKAIENQPGLSWSIKQSFLNEIDETINSCLNEEYEKFRRAVEEQPNLNIPVKQSLLLLATAVTLRKDNELAKLVDQLLGMGSLPEPLERNLLLLAQQAQIKVEGVKEELNQFRQEVENWFDRSMERSSGVYKRNAKLVAIIIGSLVAVAVNADTVHIVTRLSKDQILRSQVTTAADQIATNSSDITAKCLSYGTEAQRSADPDCSETLDKLNRATDNISLPIGWGTSNRLQQADEARSWGILGFFQYPLGWLVSGIALSMGASFWYEMLGKFIDVRNVGKKPPSPKDQPNSDKD